MSNRTKVIIAVLAILLCMSFACNVYQYAQSQNEENKVIVLHDTIRIDSIRIQEHTRPIYVTHHDTCIVYRRDTICDTLTIEIPIEHKVYTDTINHDSTQWKLDIGFSGYKAKIDSANISVLHTKEVSFNKPKSYMMGQTISIGLQAGYGMGFEGMTIHPSPYIGIGINYGFGITWKTK